jgi:hypothetical protein
MTWKSQDRIRIFLSAAFISLVITIGCDTRAQTYPNYSIYCPAGKTYVAGKYECLDFSNDFHTNCKAAGQQSWVVSVQGSSAPGCNVPGHAFDVVTAPSCDLASDLKRYCAVEPQNGNQWCWTQNATGSPKIPSWILQSVLGNGALYACYAKGEYFISLRGG